MGGGVSHAAEEWESWGGMMKVFYGNDYLGLGSSIGLKGCSAELRSMY